MCSGRLCFFHFRFLFIHQLGVCMYIYPSTHPSILLHISKSGWQEEGATFCCIILVANKYTLLTSSFEYLLVLCHSTTILAVSVSTPAVLSQSSVNSSLPSRAFLEVTEDLSSPSLTLPFLTSNCIKQK